MTLVPSPALVQRPQMFTYYRGNVLFLVYGVGRKARGQAKKAECLKMCIPRGRSSDVDGRWTGGEGYLIARWPAAVTTNHVVVVEQWLKQGFDVYKESPKAIIKRLRQENLEAFLTSNKSL